MEDFDKILDVLKVSIEQLKPLQDVINHVEVDLSKLKKTLPPEFKATLESKLSEIRGNRRTFDEQMTKLKEQCQY